MVKYFFLFRKYLKGCKSIQKTNLTLYVRSGNKRVLKRDSKNIQQNWLLFNKIKTATKYSILANVFNCYKRIFEYLIHTITKSNKLIYTKQIKFVRPNILLA